MYMKRLVHLAILAVLTVAAPVQAVKRNQISHPLPVFPLKKFPTSWK